MKWIEVGGYYYLLAENISLAKTSDSKHLLCIPRTKNVQTITNLTYQSSWWVQVVIAIHPKIHECRQPTASTFSIIFITTIITTTLSWDKCPISEQDCLFRQITADSSLPGWNVKKSSTFELSHKYTNPDMTSNKKHIFCLKLMCQEDILYGF